MRRTPHLIPLLHPALPESISMLASLREPESPGEPKRIRERVDGDFLLRALLQRMGGDPSWSLQRIDGCKPVARRKGDTAWLSLSHTHGMLAGAASLDVDLGIDLEPRKRPLSPALGGRILHPDESRWWRADESEDLLRLWTLKEAALKRCGTGLRTRMNRVRVEPVRPGEFQITLASHPPMRSICWNEHDHWISVAWTEVE
ncbi:MAG: 4'-phosphopantetheinyl transferase superfamily protein [Balneolaceae bacterium]